MVNPFDFYEKNMILEHDLFINRYRTKLINVGHVKNYFLGQYKFKTELDDVSQN